MDAIQALLTRRSVRRFTPEAVDAAAVETLLRAAMNAPTSGNAQEWRFVVIDERAMLDGIASFHPSAPVLNEAPLAILVCADVGAEKNPGRWVLDGAIAAENILLAAHALHLGAVWLAVWPLADRAGQFARLFCLPESVQPLALVAVGHPRETPPAADRYDAKKVHFNRW